MWQVGRCGCQSHEGWVEQSALYAYLLSCRQVGPRVPVKAETHYKRSKITNFAIVGLFLNAQFNHFWQFVDRKRPNSTIIRREQIFGCCWYLDRRGVGASGRGVGRRGKVLACPTKHVATKRVINY